MPTTDAAEQRAVAYYTENHPAARVHNIAGTSVTAVSVMPSADDDEFREMARGIEEKSPHWLVVWGTYTRQFVAFPLFDAPRGTILAAGYPDALTGRIREAERRFQRRTGEEV
jgi:hypothetical protein